MSQAIVSSKYRTLSGAWRVPVAVAPALAILLALLYFRGVQPFGYTLVDMNYLYFLLALFIPLIFIWIPPTQSAAKDRVPWYDFLLAVASSGILVFFGLSIWEVIYHGWGVIAPLYVVVIGAVLWLMVIEAGRRCVGAIFAGFVSIFSVYPLFGTYLPGFFNTRDFPLDGVINFHVMSGTSMMGVPVHAFGTLVIGFLVFAVAIQVAGVGKFFNQVAASLLQNVRAHNAKVAIIASGLFGSISGSTVPNIMTTGSFTIPAMKSEGLSAEFACGVEAAASTGGALMPPIMGITAFVMAEFLGISYVNVCIYAVVPSVLYYLCLFAQIDSNAAKLGIKPSRTADQPPLWRILLHNYTVIAGFLILLFYVFYMRLLVWAPWYATAAILILCMIRKETRLSLHDAEVGLQRVGKTLGELVGIVSAVGLIVGGLIMTGKALSLPFMIVQIVGGNLFLLLLIGAIVAMILGMGVPIVASYIFLAIVLAPGLVEGGVDLIAAHMFVMYCSMFSYITPPVAIAAYAAAALGGANPLKTGFQAMRLGVAKYILPFCFAMSPALILRGGSPLEIIEAVCTCALGLTVISGALEGYVWRLGKVGIIVRVLTFAGGLALAYPSVYTDLVAIPILGVGAGAHWILTRMKYQKV